MGLVGIVVDSNVLLEHLNGTFELTKARRKVINLLFDSLSIITL
jgi:hypothetical protein